jgi:LysR family transcriptional regulator, hydrogen peroxide-inducible genes activator
MQADQVRYFLALCREQNFTAAARRCGISQPSLTNAIKRLEREFGGELFHRGSSLTSLSELGRAVRPHLEKVAQCIEDARREASCLTSSTSNPINGVRHEQTFVPGRRPRARNARNDVRK